MNENIEYLVNARDQLHKIDYDIIYKKIADIENKRALSAKLLKGHLVDRVRINHILPGGELQIYTSMDQISYVADKDILVKRSGFGRANCPKQSIFYGSIKTPEIDYGFISAYFETSKEARLINSKTEFKEVFTIGRWKILEDFEVLEMIYADKAFDKNQYNRWALENQRFKYQDSPFAAHYEEQGKFFSDEYARDDIENGESYKYKITAAYTNYVLLKMPHLMGVTYPSVAAEYKGQNVALWPSAVDRYLRLEQTLMVKFEKSNGNNIIEVIGKVVDFGKDNKNFKWEPVKS